MRSGAGGRHEERGQGSGAYSSGHLGCCSCWLQASGRWGRPPEQAWHPATTPLTGLQSGTRLPLRSSAPATAAQPSAATRGMVQRTPSLARMPAQPVPRRTSPNSSANSLASSSLGASPLTGLGSTSMQLVGRLVSPAAPSSSCRQRAPGAAGQRQHTEKAGLGLAGSENERGIRDQLPGALQGRAPWRGRRCRARRCPRTARAAA